MDSQMFFQSSSALKKYIYIYLAMDFLMPMYVLNTDF